MFKRFSLSKQNANFNDILSLKI